MKRIYFLMVVFAAALLCACGEKAPDWKNEAGKVTVDPTVAAKVGDVLPAWEEGWLDIHSINSGRGESFFYIFPDGTTMLIDAAGAWNDETHDYGDGNSPGVPSKPSVNVTSTSVISNYIRHYMPKIADGKLDYVMVSHYHGDHMGVVDSQYQLHSQGNFRMNGIPGVGSAFPVVKLLDRGNFDDPPSSDWFSGTTAYDNYIKFANWSASTNGTVREKVNVGATDQIVMKHNPSITSRFMVRNVAAGGYVWTGTGTGSATALPSTAELKALGKNNAGQVGENVMSVALLLSLGNFDWFTAGDSQFNDRSNYSYKDIEAPMAKAINKHVEAMKASHHCTANTNSSELLSVLTPDVLVACAWRDVQPNSATVKRFINANSLVRIFATNLTDNNRNVLTTNGVDVGKFACTSGHVVIRVQPDGARYWVFALDDTDEQYRISKRLGPLMSR